MTISFNERLGTAWGESGSLVCVGLDPEMSRLPARIEREDRPFLEFNKRIIDATLPYACAYKPQFAHYAAAGRLDELQATIRYIRERAPDRVVILDAKRGDIGNTARHYASEAFGIYGAHAVTVNPYMGGDTLEPFSGDPAYGVMVLCKTSNPGSAELQDLKLANGEPLFLEVARKAAADWNANRNLCLVVGATYPGELARIRHVAPEMPFLVPGIGAQGGDLEATLEAGLRRDGLGLLINSSRGILFASPGDDFAEAAGRAAADLKAACNAVRTRLQGAAGP